MESFSEFIYRVRSHRSAPAISDNLGVFPQSYDYIELAEKIQSFAQAYFGLGVIENSKVVLVLEYDSEWILHFFALQLLGAKVIPLEPRVARKSLQNYDDYEFIALDFSQSHFVLNPKDLNQKIVLIDVIDIDTYEKVAEEVAFDGLMKPGNRTSLILIGEQGQVQEWSFLALLRQAESFVSDTKLDFDHVLFSTRNIFSAQSIATNLLAPFLQGALVVLDKFEKLDELTDILSRKEVSHLLLNEKQFNYFNRYIEKTSESLDLTLEWKLAISSQLKKYLAIDPSLLIGKSKHPIVSCLKHISIDSNSELQNQKSWLWSGFGVDVSVLKDKGL